MPTSNLELGEPASSRSNQAVPQSHFISPNPDAVADEVSSPSEPYETAHEPVELELAHEDSDSNTDDDNYGLKEFTKPERSSLNQTASYDDYVRLLKVFTPRDMDDRWVLRCAKLNPETNRGAIHLYRSWTGYEDLRGEFFLLNHVHPEEPKVPYVVFDRIWYETDPKRRGETNAEEAKSMFARLMRSLVGVVMIDRDQPPR